jgi:circadian clock protein KaiC
MRHPDIRDEAAMPRLLSGLPGLDAILGGGLPTGSMTVVAGPPGAGKTILAQQVCFQRSSQTDRALYFHTLAEPTAKTLRYLGQFAFFEATKLEDAVRFVDLGDIASTGGLDQAADCILEHVEHVKPAVIVVDSFKMFDDLAPTREDLRRFGYQLAVRLMVWECTALLLGGYRAHERAANPLFSVVDGIILLAARRSAGKRRRFLEVVKMRGTGHSRDPHEFKITRRGIELLSPVGGARDR